MIPWTTRRCLGVVVSSCHGPMVAAASRPRRGGPLSPVAPGETLRGSIPQCPPGGEVSKVPADGWRARRIASDANPAHAPSGEADRSGETVFGLPPKRRGGLWTSSRRLLPPSRRVVLMGNAQGPIRASHTRCVVHRGHHAVPMRLSLPWDGCHTTQAAVSSGPVTARRPRRWVPRPA